jgi:hypothetical protein
MSWEVRRLGFEWGRSEKWGKCYKYLQVTASEPSCQCASSKVGTTAVFFRARLMNYRRGSGLWCAGDKLITSTQLLAGASAVFPGPVPDQATSFHPRTVPLVH